MSFGDNLKYFRNKRHLSQRKLAEELQCSHSLIAMYESSDRKPSFDLLCRVAWYFGVPINRLVEDLDEDETEKRLLYAWENADPVYKKIALELLESHQKSQG